MLTNMNLRYVKSLARDSHENCGTKRPLFNLCAAVSSVAIAGAMNVLYANPAWAACTDATVLTAAAGDNCTASQATYTDSVANTSHDGVVKANGAGATIDATTVTSITNSNTNTARTTRGDAVLALNGGTVNLGTVTLATNAGGSSAIYASGAGSTVTASGDVTAITLGGNQAYDYSSGIVAWNGGKVTIAGKLTTDTGTSNTGSDQHGVWAFGAGSIVTLGEVQSTVHTGASVALNALAGGVVKATQVDLRVNTAGGYAYGLLSDGVGSTIEIGGGKIVVNDIGVGAGTPLAVLTGNHSNSAVRAIRGGVIIINDVVATDTHGTASRGLYASESGAITVGGADIKTSGAFAHGIQIGKSRAIGTGPGSLTATGDLNIYTGDITSSAIHVEGNGSFIEASTGSTTIDAAGNAIVFGGSANAADQDTTAKVALNNVMIGTRSSNSDLILVGGANTGSSLAITGTGSLTAASDGWLVNVQDQVVSDDALATRIKASTFDMWISGATTLTGSMTKSADSTFMVKLSNGATWNVLGLDGNVSETSSFTDLKLESGATINAFASGGTGNYTINVTNNLTNSGGVISLRDGVAGDVLSVSGNYVSDGGSLNLDTVLNDGVIDQSDVLRASSVSMGAGGATQIFVTNSLPGQGGDTDVNANGMWDEGEGILLVNVLDAARSDSGAFALGTASLIDSGFAYELQFGAIGGDWYLASTAMPVTPGCGGATIIDSAVSDVLGCIPDETFIISGTSTVNGLLEGAGGSDTINVLGSASVVGGVYGGGNGQDLSAASDTGDVITINTTGTVGLVDGQLGDDVIDLLGGTIIGNALGGDGNDTISLAGATVAGSIDGGAGDDLVTLTAGSAGSVLGGDGNDTVNWNSAAATTPLVSMGNGSDTVNINDPAINLASVTLDGGDDTSTADGMIDTLNLNNGWSGNLVGAQTTNWEVLNINGGTVKFSDAAITAGVINVNNGGRLDGSNGLVATSDVVVGSGSTLVAGNNTGTNAMRISGSLTNGGTVDLRGPTGVNAVGDRLTVGGNYVGVSGGLIKLDTVLGGDGSPTDGLIVNGDLGGTNVVSVTNVGGVGALTSGDGIRLVQVDGTSAPDALSLQGNTIDVGAYRYALYNGGLADPNDQDWYLRSRARDIVIPTISVARVAHDMGLTALGTLHERVGEQEHYGLQSMESGFFKGMWGRAIGKDYSETAKSAAFGDSRSNGQLGGLQMGLDLYRGASDNGSRTYVGVYGGHLWSGTTDFMVTPLSYLAGKTRSDGWVAGLYATHYAASGWYADAVVQGDWLKHRANATDGTTLATKSRSVLASLEVGKPFGTKWKVEPQVQVIYGHTTLDDAIDSAGVRNQIGVGDSWTGRAGFRLKRTWDYDQTNDGGLFTFYAKANVWASLDGGKTMLTIGGSAPGAVQYKQVWGDVGVGTTFSLAKNAEFFADAEVEYGLDQGATALAGRAGLRIHW